MHVTPYETEEFAQDNEWRRLARAGDLRVIRTVAAWSDICGFGAMLESAGWDLEKLRTNGVFELLSWAYRMLGKPFFIGLPPEPSDRVLVLNDGVARSLDLGLLANPYPVQILFYIRDLFMSHYMLEEVLSARGLGLRTVLAGGERCQYSPNQVTGELFVYHSGEPSWHGKRILEQQFTYNPGEFQMNTAFARAYTLDTLGSRGGLTPNRVYLEENWLAAMREALPDFVSISESSVEFMLAGKSAISVFWDAKTPVNAKGSTTNVYRVSEVIVRDTLESEETSFPMARRDVWD